MRHKELMLDRRSRNDLCRRMEELAASYTPEWRFDRKNPDIGSTLALIYANQMEDNIRRMNQLPEKYHTEFVNLLGLNLKPSYPSSGVVVVDLLRGTVPGVALPRGSRLMAEQADGEPVLFETMGDVYITNAQMTDVLSISGTKGKIHALSGELKAAALMPKETLQTEEEKEEWQEEILPPFALFDYEKTGIQQNAVMLYHRNAFGMEPGIPIQLRIVTPEGRCLAEELTNKAQWRWSYYSQEGLKPFEQVSVQGEVIVLQREEISTPVNVQGISYHLICLEAVQAVSTSVTVGDIRISSEKAPAPPACFLHAGEELDCQACMPLGETASVFEECYICDDQVFSQQDATIRLSFSLSNKRKMMQLTVQQERDELKIIKRKPRAVQYETVTTSPQRVALEYYNGQVWRRLPGSSDWETLFDGTKSGEFEIAFLCPSDWASVPIQGYQGRCIRLRVTQADNCYLLPCEHTMPQLENVRVSYRYEGTWKQPQVLHTICGTQKRDQTRTLMEGEATTILRPLPYPEASLYLGFDRPMEGAPVSILFDVEENVHFHMEPVVFEYSTRTGFKQMKVIDKTENFSRAGTVLFMPPADFAPIEVEGIRRWWLRLRGEEKALEGYHPIIKSIRLNAVDIRNQQTHPEESFYVETPTPNMTFPLAARNILSAEVFVSEMDQLSRHQMRELLEECPGDVKAEYDFLGEITAFYVRWTEVDSFDQSKSGDRHYMIDRARNVLVFGDGVHARLPHAQYGPAVLVRAVSCDGARGNVPEGAINSFYGNVMYVERVRNPMATFAGSDLEDLDSARRRGADILCSRGRLISENDFTRAVSAFSGTIEKVKCMAGYDIDGQPDPFRITIAMMTRDYVEGAHAFNNIREPLKRRLLDGCDATVTQECLVLSEPIYIEISVSVWVKVQDASRSFEVQELILEKVRRFLDPLPSPGHGGWEIGILPTENQLKMLLQSLRFQGQVGRIIMVGRYVDKNGVHEASLDQLPRSPFAIGVNGDHKIYVEFQ